MSRGRYHHESWWTSRGIAFKLPAGRVVPLGGRDRDMGFGGFSAFIFV